MGLLPTLAKSLPRNLHVSGIVPYVAQAVSDPSWRVRYMLADIMTQLQAAMDTAVADTHLLPAFVKVLVDPEAEVRNCAASKVVKRSGK